MKALRVHVTVSDGDRVLYDANRKVYVDAVMLGYSAGLEEDELDKYAETELTAAVLAALP